MMLCGLNTSMAFSCVIVLVDLVLCQGFVTARLHRRTNSNRKDKSRKNRDENDYEPITEQERIRQMAGSAEQDVLLHLLDNYDPDARGVINANETVTVSIQLLLLRIQGLDERSQVLTTTGLIITDWMDHRLQWDPVDFDNLTDIVIRPDRIWLPELALMNGAEETAPDFRRIRVLVNHDGGVHWEPGGIFTTTCDIDIRFFPFDDQACVIQIGAWAYYSARMNITNSSHEIITHGLALNGEWEVYLTRAEWKENILPCCPNTRYPYVEFTLFLRRRYTYYLMNIILPCTLLSVLVMVVFCLPPDAGEKISLGISVLLAFTVFLLMVAENVPRTSLHIPIMVMYLTCTMALGTVSVCLTVLVLNLHHRDTARPVPKWARVFVLSYLSRILCVKSRRAKRNRANKFSSHDPRDGSISLKSGLRRIARDVGLLKPMLIPNGDVNVNDGSKYANGDQIFHASCNQGSCRHVETNNDWKEVAHVLDRLFFWIVFVLMTASAMIILIVPMYKDYKEP